eukprot:Selendium_serpulae@DN630_c0_g1_i4.p1
MNARVWTLALVGLLGVAPGDGVSLAGAAQSVGTEGFVLPELPYRYDALEPSIDARTMEIHHSKHHSGYVTKLNAATSRSLSNAELSKVVTEVGLDETAVRNNGGGHYNHALFWQTMTPLDSKAAEVPKRLSNALNESFGKDGMNTMKTKFAEAAGKRFGSGWAWLGVDTSTGKLKVTSTANQDNPLMKNVVKKDVMLPILGLDVWEHAYYLKYQNLRASYVEEWWKVVNWTKVDEIYGNALAGRAFELA